MQQERPAPHEGWYGARTRVDHADGMEWSHANTDTEGRFEVTGLREGRFFIEPSDCKDLRSNPRELYPTGGDEVIIRVRRYRLIVEVVAPEEMEELPTYAHVFVRGTEKHGGNDFMTHGLWQNRCAITTKPGDVVQVGIHLFDWIIDEATVRFDDGVAEKKITLRPRPPKFMGKIEVTAVDAAGNPVPGARFALDSAQTRLPLHFYRTRADGRSFALPAGPVVLKVTVPQTGELRWSVFEKRIVVPADGTLQIEAPLDRISTH